MFGLDRTFFLQTQKHKVNPHFCRAHRRWRETKAPISLGRRSWRPWRSVKISQSVAESSSNSIFSLRGDYTGTSLRSTCAEGNGNTMIYDAATFLPRFEAEEMRCFCDHSDRLPRLIRLLRPRYNGATSGATVIRSCWALATISSNDDIFFSWLPASD